VTSVVLGVLAAAAATGWDWPQWRGPGRDGAGGVVHAADAWPNELTRRWRAEVGAGQASPVVAGRTAFVFTREGELEVARALDLATGALRWRQAYAAPYRVYPGAAAYGSGPKSTPVVHEGRLFTLGIGGILSAFAAADGRVLWRKDFEGRFRQTAPPFGTSMSPLVAQGLLVVHAGGHDGGALMALDPATGAEKWILEGEGPSYSSPIVASPDGREQIVIQVHRKLLGVEPESGRVLWSLPFVTPCDQNIVTPLHAGDVIVASSLDRGTMGVRVVLEGGTWVPRVAWHTREVSLYMSSPVLARGRVLGLSHLKRGQYFALDPSTGAVDWKSDPAQGENAALVRTGDSVLVLQGDGSLLVLPADGASFRPLRRYAVADTATYAHPIPTELGILVKDEAGLALYGLAAASASDR